MAETIKQEKMAPEDPAQSRCGKRLKSTQFTLFVGPSKVTYVIHEDVLHASPVLAYMCSEMTKANACPHLYLPDDDPDDIGCLFEFLYGSDFDSLSDAKDFKAASVDVQSKATDELCRIYMLAEKYQLGTLKECVVGKFDTTANIDKSPLSFLDLAKKMYDLILESDSTYSDFFVKTAQVMLGAPTLHSNVHEWIDEQAGQAGRLAKDLFVAQRKVYETHTAQHQKDIAVWSYKFKHSENNLSHAHKRINNLVAHHGDEHGDECDWEV
ncbi:MAG: hypothetical protein Q9202_000393 [Teloschistes flavicans]